MKNSANQLIYRHFQRQKKINKNLSLRSLAKDLKISAGYLSKIFSGQKNLTPSLALKLGRKLKVDDLQLDQMNAALQSEILKTHFGSVTTVHRKTRKPVEMLTEVTLMEPQAEWLLEKWYRLAILDLVTCVNFQDSADWIAQRLKLKPNVVTETLNYFIRDGYLSKTPEGRLSKTYEKLRFPSKFSKEVYRRYHEIQMKRAAEYMNANTGLKDFERRLIAGVGLAGNPDNLEKAKQILHRALYEASEALSSGPCTEVYHIGLQLFPQTSDTD